MLLVSYPCGHCTLVGEVSWPAMMAAMFGMQLLVLLLKVLWYGDGLPKYLSTSREILRLHLFVGASSFQGGLNHSTSLFSFFSLLLGALAPWNTADSV